jgi:BASS family bile acid:Na+ symporter
MDLKQLAMLALRISIVATVFGFGLKATTADLLYLVHRPGLLARSLLAMFVIMPVVALTLVWLFDFPQAVNVVLVALAISPVPPLLPMKETRAGGDLSFGLGLMAMLALLSIVAVPLMLAILGLIVGWPLGMSPGPVAGVMVKAILIPLAVGMIVRAVSPGMADRLAAMVMVVVKVLLPVAVVAVLAGAMTAIYALIGAGTVLALTIFTVAGLAIGHALGGPESGHSSVLALSTACRHPAIAFAIASTNFPDLHFAALILLYLIVGTIIGLPYLMWQTGVGWPFRAASRRG